MTEASGGDGRAEMERRLIQRSLEDGAFRQRLLDDPRAAVERDLGATAARGTLRSGARSGSWRLGHIPSAWLPIAPRAAKAPNT
jgi:hypothetical protein